MRKYIKALLIALTVIILTPAIAVLAGYNSSVSVRNTGATAYDMLACNLSANVAYWESDGFIGENGTDVRIYRGAVEIHHMMVTDRITFALPVLAYSSQTLQITTGETPLTDFYIIPGYSNNSSVGYVSIPDAALIELGDNFTATFNDIYLNTDNGTDKNLLRKDDAISVYVSPTMAGNITACILSDTDNITPASVSDPSTVWSSEANTIDGDTGTHGYLTPTANVWTGYLVYSTGGNLLTNGMHIYYGGVGSSYAPHFIDIDAYRNGVWVPVADEVPYVAGEWLYYSTNTTDYVTQFRARFKRTDTTQIRIYEVLLDGNIIQAAATVTGISSGEYDMTVSATTTHLILTVGAAMNSTALGGASVPDNGNDYYLFENNSMSYCDSMTLEIAGVPQLYYNPNDIIVSTGTTGTLPDRVGANDGTIYWGGNPANIALTLSAFESDYTVDTEIAIRPVEIVPDVSVDTLTTADAAKIAALSVKDPALYPLISAINGAVGIPIMFMYQGVFFALAVGLLFLFGKFGHLTIGVIVSLVVIGFATAWGVYDVVMLVILIICGLGLILTQGRQTV